MSAEKDKYTVAIELADAIVSRVRRVLTTALERVGNPALVKATLADPRVKSFASIARKAEEKRWSVEDTIERCWDFVGFRVVCNNLQDVQRAADLFEQELNKLGFRPKRLDYIEKPQPSGYRGIHVIFPVTQVFGNNKMTLSCEIQIRTRLQDAWGHLSREELYRKRVPERLIARMTELANTLAKADEVAEEIRKEISKGRKGQEPEAGSSLTPDALAFIYHRAFGGDPPAYLIERAMDQIGSGAIRADALDALLHDADFREKVDSAYLENTKWSPYPEQVLEWAVQAALSGKRSGISLARREGKEDWAEIDAQYKSELSYAIPDTWPELKEKFEDGTAEIETLANYFDTVDKCMCGTEIVEFEDLAPAVISHYQLSGKDADEAEELVGAALNASDLDDAEGTGLCSYCFHVLNKDD